MDDWKTGVKFVVGLQMFLFHCVHTS